MDKQPTFSVNVFIKDRPTVELGVDLDSCWLTVDTFTNQNSGLSAVSIYLPDDPATVLALAEDIRRAGETMAATKAKQPEPVEQS